MRFETANKTDASPALSGLLQRHCGRHVAAAAGLADFFDVRLERTGLGGPPLDEYGPCAARRDLRGLFDALPIAALDHQHAPRTRRRLISGSLVIDAEAHERPFGPGLWQRRPR